MASSRLTNWLILFLSVNVVMKTAHCACPSLWQQNGHSCIKIFHFMVNRARASELCKKKDIGGHLIYLNKPGNWKVFVNSLTDTKNREFYFIGAQSTSGRWMWDNSVEAGAVINIAANPNKPNVKFNKQHLKFEATDGNHEANYICEFAAPSDFTASSSSSSSSSSTTSSLLSSSSSSTSALSSLSLSSSSSSLFSSSSSAAAVTLLSYSSSTAAALTPAAVSPASSVSSISSSVSSQVQVLPTSILSYNVPRKERSSMVSTTSVAVPGQTRMHDKSLITLFIENVTNLDVNQSASLNDSMNMMQDLLVALTAVDNKDHPTNQNPVLASKKLEEFALQFTENHLNDSSILIERKNLVLFARQFSSRDTADYIVKLPDTTSQMTMMKLPKENFDKQGTSVVSIYYQNMDYLMNTLIYNPQENNSYQVKSKILSTAIKPGRKSLTKNATLGFKVDTTNTGSKKNCVFWNFPSEENKVTGWSRDGCTITKVTDKYVECSCNHLTHFAILMQVEDNQFSDKHLSILTILTYIGLILSITGCILTFMAYWFFTDTQSEQSQIRMNLVLVLAVAHILFLLGSAAESNVILCISVAVFLQFFYTSALCWMFAEGVQLYMQVVKVFNTDLKMKQVYGFAWGFPLVFIICSLSIAGNGSGGLASFVNDDFCWLSVENHLVWTFIAPVLLLILGNLVILVMVLRELKRISKSMEYSLRSNALRSSIKALVVLAPLLGVTWLVGLLCILGAGVVGLYIFTILNSTQGFLIFIFHCLRNSEIRAKFQRKVQGVESVSHSHGRSDKQPAASNLAMTFKPSTPESTKTLKVPQSPRYGWPE